MTRRALATALAIAGATILPVHEAGAEDPAPPAPLPSFTDVDILGKPAPYFRIESIALRYTHFDQRGTGYQSRAGPRGGPGDQTMTVEQPQLEVVAKQGDRLTHRLWAPVDIVTAASPDAIDVVSTASRRNEAGTFDWTTTYRAAPDTSVAVRSGLHGEENYRSWNVGFAFTRSFAEDNTVLEASANQIVDWFDRYLLNGKHNWHTSRGSTNLNAGVTQLLSPTTVAHLDYGVTLQRGQLGNGWNIVPLTTGDVAIETLPRTRLRHALVGRIAQWLPWDGAAHAFYRFYVDDWGIRAHTVDLELYQRLSRFSYLRFEYRFHRQTGASFFTTRKTPRLELATADSDLAPLDAHTLGVKGTFEIPIRINRTLRLDVAVERYFRTNDLHVNVYSCGLGLLF